MDNTAFFKLSYGLFVVTAHEGDKDNGCITNTVVQQTTTPNRISVTINKNNYTHDMIKRTGVFNVSVLSEKSKFETFKHWGFQSGKDVDKTVGITYFRLENGVIYIVDGVNAVMCAKVEQEVDLGTHTMFIAEVTEAEVLQSGGVLTVEAFRNAGKDVAPNAPIYRTLDENYGYRCTVCGYIHKSEELRDSYKCPICKAPASKFEKL